MDAEPFVTVVVPVRNEIRTIDRCLGALLEQDYPRASTEILVVDGDSDDGTPEVVRDHARHAPHVRLLANPARHAASAMNVGIAAARGDVVARVDGHALVPPDFLRRTVETLVNHPDVACTSGALVTQGRTPWGRAIAAAMSSPAGVGFARFRTGARKPRLVDTVAFPVYRRETLAHLGPFDEELVRNQDDELNLRLTRRGGRILLLPDLRILYYCQGSLRGLARQYFQYGYWKVRVIQKHGAPAAWRHLVPATLVLVLALAAIAAPVPALRPFALLVPAAYAAALAVAATAIAARRKAIAQTPRIAAALATLHLAYGAGFWTGLWRFGPPRRKRAEAVAPRIDVTPRIVVAGGTSASGERGPLAAAGAARESATAARAPRRSADGA
jgi:GT2 family glycosyltransferase